MLIISGETYAHSQGEGVKPQGWHWLGLLSDIGGPSSLVKGYVKWTNSVRSKDGLIDLVERGCPNRSVARSRARFSDRFA